MNFAVLDAGIMNSFETMLKLGGYIMLFSILTYMCRHLLSAFPILCALTSGVMEVTGAVNALNDFFSDTYLKYIAILTATAFGGCSGVAQTASLIRSGKNKSALSIAVYLRGRLLIAGVTALLASIVYPLLSGC